MNAWWFRETGLNNWHQIMKCVYKNQTEPKNNNEDAQTYP